MSFVLSYPVLSYPILSCPFSPYSPCPSLNYSHPSLPLPDPSLPLNDSSLHFNEQSNVLGMESSMHFPGMEQQPTRLPHEVRHHVIALLFPIWFYSRTSSFSHILSILLHPNPLITTVTPTWNVWSVSYTHFWFLQCRLTDLSAYWFIHSSAYSPIYAFIYEFIYSFS